MPTIEKIPERDSSTMPPFKPENKEYKEGRPIRMKDGTVRIVHSLKEEMEARSEDRERELAT